MLTTRAPTKAGATEILDLNGARAESIVEPCGLERGLLGAPEPRSQQAIFVRKQRELVGREPDIERTPSLRGVDDIETDAGRGTDRGSEEAAEPPQFI